MDHLISSAAAALAAGDSLGALKQVALRNDAPALALRGIAMAQLGDFARAKALLRRAQRAFGPKQATARARCVVAEAEIAFAARDLGWPAKSLDDARARLEKAGDGLNAAHARLLQAHRFLLIGRIDDAERCSAGFLPSTLPPAARTIYELVIAGIAVRRLRIQAARTALDRATSAAGQAAIPALMAEVESARSDLDKPAARVLASGKEQLLLLDEVEALFASGSLVVDACRSVVRASDKIVSLARRPVLFALVKALAKAWPNDVSRDKLLAQAFGARRADSSHRARLRVEVGRLRKALPLLADIVATKRGFVLSPHLARKAVVLAPPANDFQSTVIALLADGESWSSSALALALGTSQRTAQRSLDSLAATGKITANSRGRTRRWTASPIAGFTTTLLLPPPLAND